MSHDVRAGLETMEALRTRIDRAMAFRVGGDPACIAAKATLRAIALAEQESDT